MVEISIDGQTAGITMFGGDSSFSSDVPTTSNTNTIIKQIPREIRQLMQSFNGDSINVNKNVVHFINCDDWCNDKFFQALKKVGTDLVAMEQSLNSINIFLGSPRKEALKRVNKVNKLHIKNVMIRDIEKGRYASAVLASTLN